MLNAADCIAIITVVPVLDSVVYPAVDRYLGRKCRGTEKYLFGLVVGTVAVASAAWLEVKRRHTPLVPACGGGVSASNNNDDVAAAAAVPTSSPTAKPDDDAFFADREGCYSQCAFTGTPMSDMPVWWMALPFFLVGTAECLCNIPIYELCYSQTPPAFRSMAQAVFLFVTAVGSMLTGAFTTSLAEYVTDDLNDGHLEYLYYTCIAFIIAFMPINVFCFSLFEEFDERLIESLGNADTPAEFAADWGAAFLRQQEQQERQQQEQGNSSFACDADEGGACEEGREDGVRPDGSTFEDGGQRVTFRQSGGGLRSGSSLAERRSSAIGLSESEGGRRSGFGRYSFGGAGGGSITL